METAEASKLPWSSIYMHDKVAGKCSDTGHVHNPIDLIQCLCTFDPVHLVFGQGGGWGSCRARESLPRRIHVGLGKCTQEDSCRARQVYPGGFM